MPSDRESCRCVVRKSYPKCNIQLLPVNNLIVDMQYCAPGKQTWTWVVWEVNVFAIVNKWYKIVLLFDVTKLAFERSLYFTKPVFFCFLTVQRHVN